MRGTLLAGLLVLAVVVIAAVQTRPARAYETYCFDDPVFLIGGQILDVQVQQPVETVLTARSTTLTVIIPVNVSGIILVDDVSAFPMETTIERSGPPWLGGPIPVRIVVFVDAALNYPIRVVATKPGALLAEGRPLSETERGRSNRRTVLNITLPSSILPPLTVTPTVPPTTATPSPTVTPQPTVTPAPTLTPVPTLPPLPTVTPPTATASPTSTPTAAPTRPPRPGRDSEVEPDVDGAGRRRTPTPTATPPVLPVLPVLPGAASLLPGR